MTKKKTAGFTLIELMVTVAIIGILAAIAIPGYIGYRLKAERSNAWTDLQSIRLLQEQFYAENSVYAGPFADTATTMVGFPAFRPDLNTQALYEYNIVVAPINGIVAQAFTATATRILGSDVGSPWTITQNNITNF